MKAQPQKEWRNVKMVYTTTTIIMKHMLLRIIPIRERTDQMMKRERCQIQWIYHQQKSELSSKKYRNNLLETGNEITSSSMMEKCADKIYNDNETYANMDTKNKKKKTQIN